MICGCHDTLGGLRHPRMGGIETPLPLLTPVMVEWETGESGAAGTTYGITPWPMEPHPTMYM